MKNLAFAIFSKMASTLVLTALTYFVTQSHLFFYSSASLCLAEDNKDSASDSEIDAKSPSAKPKSGAQALPHSPPRQRPGDESPRSTQFPSTIYESIPDINSRY